MFDGLPKISPQSQGASFLIFYHVLKTRYNAHFQSECFFVVPVPFELGRQSNASYDQGISDHQLPFVWIWIIPLFTPLLLTLEVLCNKEISRDAHRFSGFQAGRFVRVSNRMEPLIGFLLPPHSVAIFLRILSGSNVIEYRQPCNRCRLNYSRDQPHCNLQLCISNIPVWQLLSHTYVPYATGKYIRAKAVVLSFRSTLRNTGEPLDDVIPGVYFCASVFYMFPIR